MNADLLKLLANRRFWTGTWIYVLAAFVLCNLGGHFIYKYEVDRLKQIIQANVEDEQKVNSAGDKIPRYDLSVGQNLQTYWPSIPDSRTTRLAILSGMSQMHSIGDRQHGDELICQRLDDALAPKGTRVWGFAAPNLCNEEAVFQLVSLLSDPAKHPQIFIYGLCFDKMRNTDLRVGYQQFLREHPEIQTAYGATAHQFEKAYPLAASSMLQSLADVQKSQAQQAESFESHLREAVGKVIPLVYERKDINIWAQIRLIHVRNAVLRIKAETKRPIIKSRYEMNFQFLGMLNDLAAANGVRTIYYVIPLNPLAENPYVAAEYEKFKADAQAYCEKNQIPFANFENLVPATDWGTFMGGPDFKHFKGVGHTRTANAILETFGPLLVSPGQRAGGQTK